MFSPSRLFFPRVFALAAPDEAAPGAHSAALAPGPPNPYRSKQRRSPRMTDELSTAETRDRAEIGAALDEMYAMISGPKGPRDWSRQANCFHPEARQIRTTIDAAGRPACRIMTLADYAGDTTPFFAANDFHEVEIARRIDVFGNIANVWSAYEARNARDDAEPERRGINSIQLFRDPDHGWRIIAMIW